MIFTADDGCENEATCTQTITFDSSDAPVFEGCDAGSLPVVTQQCPGVDGFTFTTTTLSATDASDCNDLDYTPPADPTLFCNQDITVTHTGM